MVLKCSVSVRYLLLELSHIVHSSVVSNASSIAKFLHDCL